MDDDRDLSLGPLSLFHSAFRTPGAGAEAFVSPTWFMIDLNLKYDSIKRWDLLRVCLLL